MVRILVLVVVLSILGGVSLYIAYGIYRGLGCFVEGIKLWPVLTVILALVVVVILAFVRGLMPLPKDINSVLGWVGGYGMGILMYLLLFTLGAELLLLVPRLMKLSFTTHERCKGFVTLGVFLLTVLTCLYGVIHARQIHHVSYEVQVEGKADISDLNIVLISDLHLGAVGSENRLENIVQELNTLQPDVVCIAGDFFDTDFNSIRNPDRALKTLKKLKATYGVYAALGNHDGGSTYEQMVGFLENADIHLLEDGYTVIDNRLILAGRLDATPIGGYGEGKRKAFSQVATWEDTTLPVVVMDHNPAHIGEYGADADLILCGHTHKGQVFPGSLITDRIYTVDYGYYRKDLQSPHVIVTSGIGTWGMPIRVGSDCEIVSIRIS